mmetsp:Transcript_11584/g.34119  ORF Transcript_11584/g.34119 Transcript_11584/m.34119 type:complete len:219 (+) Transcript_11584:1047-1703(+)
MLSLEFSCNCCNRGCIAPSRNTKSRHVGESPAIFPKAQTACSRTSSFGDKSNLQKMGTAPSSITTRVWSEVPDAMFVSAQAASNCNAGASSFCKNCTKRGTTPASMTVWMGGFRSIDKSLRNCVVASKCTEGSILWTPATRLGSCSSFWTTVASICAGVWPCAGRWTPCRLLFMRSSFLDLRIWIVVSSRRLRESSAEMPALNWLLRSLGLANPLIFA